MRTILFELLNVLPATVIVLCQLLLGYFLTSRFSQKLSVISMWAVGVAALSCLNTLFLAAGTGFLIHLNILCLLLLPKLKKIPWVLSRTAILPLTIITVLFLFSNVLNPVMEWDAQCSYLFNARHWAQNGSLNPDGIWHIFARRPQLVSVVWTWGLMWGNETTCQFIDLCFYLGILIWISEKFNLSATKICILFAVSLAAVMRLDSSGQFFLTPSWFPQLMGVGGNNFFLYLILVAFIDCLRTLPKSLPIWILLTCAFANIRWNAVPIYPALALLAWWFHKKNYRLLFLLLAVPLLGSPWYLWNWIVHQSPIYPHSAGLFHPIPMNKLLWSEYSQLATNPFYGVNGVRNLSNLIEYFYDLGLICLAFLYTLFLRPQNNKVLFILTWFIVLVSCFLTSQLKLQTFSVLTLSAFLITSAPQNNLLKTAKGFIVGLLVATSYPSFVNLAHSSWSALRDTSQGSDYLLHNRIRLYPAAQWLNEQSAPGIVIWPMNPNYYLKLPSIRLDNAGYQIPDHLLDSPQDVSNYFKKLGVRWIVTADPFYEATYMPVLNYMNEQLKWMTQHDPDWKFVKLIPQDNMSPEAKIWQLGTNQNSDE